MCPGRHVGYVCPDHPFDPLKWKKDESRLLSDVLSELLSTVLIHLDMNFGAEIPLLNRLGDIPSTDRTLQRLLPPEPTILVLTIKNVSREARKMGTGKDYVET